jgi:MYXO-CTERM domain-containing protein
MSLSTLLVLTSVMLSPAPGTSAPMDVFGAIDSRYQQSAIDAETRLLYRVAAVRRPDLLPTDLRDLAVQSGGSSRRSLTPIFLEAMRWVQANDAQGGALHRLLLPLADLDFVLDSATHPIRVSYATEWDQPRAEWTLEAAEISWDVLTQDYGFWEPPIEPGTDRYRFYITSTNGSGSAYTAPYDENPATPHTDYFTYIVVDPAQNNQWNIAGTVAHELAHSTQAAMDVLEPTAFWENTATYIMSRVFPDAMNYTIGTMYLFQDQPWRALDYMNLQNSDLYEYGGGLFVWYLADTFAPEEPPQFVAQIWQNCVQNGLPNEPDYFDAIEETVAARGFDRTMEEILLDFSEARFFVGARDDGEHIDDAWKFNGAEVALAAHHYQSDLPLRSESPPAFATPASFGSNHILLDLPTSYDHPLTVRFDGDDDTRWAARLVFFGDGKATESTPLELATETWDATVVIEPTGYESLLLVVANLGPQGYDPDTYQANNWPLSNYTYGFEPMLDPPSDLVLEPAVVERGQQDVSFVLGGKGFVAGELFDLELVDPDIQVVSIDRVLSEDVSFRLTIPLLTELGPKDLIVTNSDGKQVTAPGILTVVEHGSIVPDGGLGSGDQIMGGGGCGCRSSGSPTTGLDPSLLLPLVGLLALFWRRRRWR